MKRNVVFFSAAALLLAALWYADTRLAGRNAPAGTPTPLPARTSEPTPSPAAGMGPRVVVISLGGAQAARAQEYLAGGTMPNLARLKAQGAMAQYALSVDPPLTGPAHASLASGSYPASTNVPADRFHRAGDDLNQATAGLVQAEALAEPVWRTAMRDARRTAAICWPGIDVDNAASLADFTVGYGTSDAEPAQHVVTFTQALTWTAAPRSFSPLREGALTILKDGSPLAQVFVLAVDTTDDDQANYDTYILDRARQVTPASAQLRLDQSALLEVDDCVHSGAYFRLTRVDADRVTIYQGRVCYNRAQPDELVREVNNRFGFFPAGPDDDALRHNWITPAQYLEMAQVQSRWIISVTAFVLETYKPELLFAWQGAADQVQRPFLLVDPRQPNYTPERAAEYARYVGQGYALADEAVGSLAGALDLQQTTLLVVSDHGMAPIHSQVFVNTILYNTKLKYQRLLVYEGSPGAYRADVVQSRALAFASGGAGQVYINLRGRERAGTVPEQDYQAVQDAIVAALQGTKDKDGQPVFSRVLRGEELNALNLDTTSAGDVFLQAAPGYALSDALGSPAAIAPATEYGQCGLVASLPQMQAIFLAVGRGIRGGAEVGPVHILDVAPTVDHLLGLEGPPTLSGRVLDEVLAPAG